MLVQHNNVPAVRIFATLAAASRLWCARLHVSFARFLSLSQRGGRSSYFDNINAAPEEGADESWNKYSAPVASGMKVGPCAVFG